MKPPSVRKLRRGTRAARENGRAVPAAPAAASARSGGGEPTEEARRPFVLDRIGSLLIRENRISAQQLDQALAAQEADPKPLGRTLVDLGLMSEIELVRMLSIQHRREFMTIDGCRVDPRTLARIPRELATCHGVLPLLEIDGTLIAGIEPGRRQGSGSLPTALDLGRELEMVDLPAGPAIEDRIQSAYQALNRRPFFEKRIGEFLVERRKLTPAQIQEALDLQRQTPQRLGEALETTAALSPPEFYELLSEHLGVPFVRFADVRTHIDHQVAKAIPRSFAEHNLIFPVRESSGSVHVLVSGRLEPWLEELVLSATRARDLSLLLAMPSDIRLAIREIYEPRRDTETAPQAVVEMCPHVEDVGDFTDVEFSPTEDVEIPNIVNYILYKALEKRASDVHIERYESSVLVRYRIDGVLHDVEDLPVGWDNVHRVLTKMKLDAKLDIAERRRPLDGVLRKRFGTSRDVDFRLAFQPTIHGENVVIRLLDRSKPLPALDEIGFSDDVLQQYLRLLENPQGMILFTGPTGSGKTTSLYATLDRLRKKPIKIITAEDPVEYNFERIQQCQVNEGLGNTFARYLRGFLRQDPDVILIGEMRDRETAAVGVEAAITGHLLFSTLHTNDAVSTVSRLLLLDIDPDMLATALLCVVSQRLVRRICSSCQDTYRPESRLIEEFFPAGVPAGFEFTRGAGCSACDQTGYKGRLPVFEFWAPDADVKARIRRGVDDSELARLAFQSGMATILDDGMRKVRTGGTSLEELRRVIPYTQIAWYQQHEGERRS